MPIENTSKIQQFLRSELSFYITLIGSVVAFAGMYNGISTKIEVMNANFSSHIEQGKDQNLNIRVGEIEKVIPVILSKLSLTSYKESNLHKT